MHKEFLFKIHAQETLNEMQIRVKRELWGAGGGIQSSYSTRQIVYKIPLAVQNVCLEAPKKVRLL